MTEKRRKIQKATFLHTMCERADRNLKTYDYERRTNQMTLFVEINPV